MANAFTTIPLDSDLPFYRFTVTLTGMTYVLHVRWNDRAGRWYFDLADSSDVLLVSSVPLLIGRNLLGRYALEGLPTGTLMVVDDTGQGTEPGRDAWGVSHSLVYVEPA
jgi:hypothetical protein